MEVGATHRSVITGHLFVVILVSDRYVYAQVLSGDDAGKYIRTPHDMWDRCMREI